MVMKKNAMRKNLRQSILKTKGRYIAISAIIALGAGLFIGLLMTKTDMVATGQKYITEQNMFDLRAISNYGWSEEYVEKFAALEGIEQAEGLIYLDMIARVGERDDAVYRFYALPEKMNMVSLRSGRMPENNRECLADGYLYDDSIIGTTVTISSENDDDSWDSMREHTYTVTGRVATPLYMDMNRGTTSLGSGSLDNYFYIPASAFDVEYYTEINLTIDGDHYIYSEEYNDTLDAIVDRIEPEAEKLSERRFAELKREAEEEFDDGYREFLDGLDEYADGLDEAEEEIADAYQELTDAEADLEEAYDDLIQAGKTIESGKLEVEEGWYEWNTSKAEFDETKASAMKEITAAREKLDESYNNLIGTYTAMESAVKAAEEALANASDADKPAKEAELSALQTNFAPLQDAMDTIMAGYAEADASEQELIAAENTLNTVKETLDSTWEDLGNAESKLMISWGEWRDGMDEVEDGWAEYYDGKAEAEEELNDAVKELREAEEELTDGWDEITSLDEADLILLDRQSNVGYCNLDSCSDIVSGVSRVFPVFFLLIASLVCITTMTRMIDEERTQIGTLKALGYSNRAIISKYMIYSGSGAILGCVLGTLLGSTIFPQIIWQAYKIMLYIQPDIVLKVDWPLAIVVMASYLAVMLLVTWYCCNKTLKEEPAELIRPKAPEIGKKIFLERLAIWQKLSFLNKVAIRNIFRYRQRMAMMLIGIGGCTALLIAGFGLRDSIVNIVDFQFQNVTQYDMSVYFRKEPDPLDQKEFLDAIEGMYDNTMFYHQSSVELDNFDRVKELYMISGDERLAEFITLQMEGEAIALPELDEIVLSVGVAENMGIHKGDTLILRNADMKEMILTVSGIYENHVENYAIVNPASIEAYWGAPPELQMAFVSVPEGQEVHLVSAAATELDTVMNVSVSADLARMVSNMMAALDLVIIVIVLCAGLLAVIVLYNLTNININERIREIATIKVLGFNAGETASYVFKENMVLTVIGSLLGLGMGWLLLVFIMAQIKIDMVWFKPVLTATSCVLAVVLTLLSAVAVIFIFYFKLDKINMAEALKSVE